MMVYIRLRKKKVKDLVGNVLNLIGSTFGRLTVISFAGLNVNKKALWTCRCECGTEIVVVSSSLRKGNTNSCGCLHREIVSESRPSKMVIDITNQVFGRLLVLHRLVTENKRARWLCACECGKKVEVYGTELRRGNTKSCGCLSRDTAKDLLTTHGQCRSRAYVTWSAMHSRCRFNPRYLKNQINVCRSWSDFLSFYKDMGEPPIGMSLDRIDNLKGYAPDNCRWATAKEQANNRRSNCRVSIGGVTKNIMEWCSDLDMPYFEIKKFCEQGTFDGFK